MMTTNTRVRDLRGSRLVGPMLLASLVWTVSASAQTYLWTPTAGGSYSWIDSSSNWGGSYPDATDAIADISADIAGNQSILLNAEITVGGLKLNDTGASGDSNFTILAGSGGSLNFQVSSGNATVTNSSGANLVSAPVTLSSNTVFDIASGTTLEFSGEIGGSGALTKSTGTGTLILSGANTYTGVTTINAGIVKLTHSSALGSTSAGTTLAGGAAGGAIQLEGGIAISGETLQVVHVNSGTGTVLQNVSGDNSWTGDITIDYGNLNQFKSDTGTLTLGNIILNTSAFRTAAFVGVGATKVDGVISGLGSVSRNSGTGGTTITQGTLSINTLADSGSASSLGSSGSITIQGGTLRYTGTGHSTNRLFTVGGATNTTSVIAASGTGAMRFTNSANVIYTVADRNFTLKLGGTSTAANLIASAITNNGAGVVSVTKEDAGRWVLSGANTYSGATTITGGTLALGANNAFSANSAITLTAGTIDLQAFNTSAASLGFAGGATLKFNLGTPGNVTALLALTGNLGKSGTGIYTLDFSGTGAVGTYNLISYAGTSFASASDFTVTNLGAGLEGMLSLNGGNLSLTVTSMIPEASSYAMVVSLLAVGGAVLRKRRR